MNLRPDTARYIGWEEGDPLPVSVDQRYDRHIRSWVTTLLDANGYQIGHALFDGTRADAAASRRFYARILAEFAAP